MKIKEIIFAIACIFAINQADTFAQNPVLKEILKDKNTYNEIAGAFENYIDTARQGPEKERMMKHMNRWAYFASMHLGPDGNFVNISEKNMEVSKSRLEPSPAMSWGGSWTFTGPNSTYLNNPEADILGNGRVDRIAFHPTDADIIYLGTPSGGLWKTSTGGSSWTCLTNALPSIGISGIVVENDNPDILYVLTGDGDSYIENGLVNMAGYLRLSSGVFKSTDGGITWQQTGVLFTEDYVGFDLVQHPTNSDILFAATSAGIYKTVDAGITWQQVLSVKIYDIEFKPLNPSSMYASGVGSFYYSTDGGDTWLDDASFNFPLCSDGRIEIAVTPALTNKVMLLAGPQTSFNAGDSFCGFYVSTNSGESFSRLSHMPNVFGDEYGEGDQSEYDIGLTVKPTNSNIIITGGLIIYKSTNGGTTFTHATTYREDGGNYIHPDIHCVAYNPLNNYLYAAGDGGFHRSLDDGVTWTNLYNGINTSQFYHMDDFDGNQYVILAGCQDNGVKFRTSNTTSFSHIYCCDGFDMAINYTFQSEGFTSINRFIYYFANFVTTAPEVVANSTTGFFARLALNSSNPDILYYSYSGIIKYDLNAGTYTDISGPGAHGHWVIKTCPSNAQKIYAAGGTSLFSEYGDMWVTADGGTTWSEISDNTGFPATFPRISDIGVNPGTSLVVYACFSGYTDGLKVLGSTNNGSTWTNISYDLPNVPIWSIEVDNANNLYVGTENGVYYKPTGATAWEPFYNSLPNVPVSDLAINTGSDQLMAATFGRGIWKSSLQDVCPATYNVTSNVSGHYFRTASSWIAMYADVIGGIGTDVVLRAGDSIILKPGFQADGNPGNKFLAYLGACESGLPPDFMGQYPVYPSELMNYKISLTRQEGTLEVPVVSTSRKNLILRLFQEGPVRIILAEETGRSSREITSFEGKKGNYSFDLDTDGLQAGMYYLYLVVDDRVVHLQELLIDTPE